jgi:hypothetical protein
MLDRHRASQCKPAAVMRGCSANIEAGTSEAIAIANTLRVSGGRKPHSDPRERDVREERRNRSNVRRHLERFGGF